MDRRAWWAAVHGGARVGHDWATNTYLLLFFADKDGRSFIQLAKARPGANCGSDHEHLVAKFRLKLKKVVKTARPFSYDLNQIPYDYTRK